MQESTYEVCSLSPLFRLLRRKRKTMSLYSTDFKIAMNTFVIMALIFSAIFYYVGFTTGLFVPIGMLSLVLILVTYVTPVKTNLSTKVVLKK